MAQLVLAPALTRWLGAGHPGADGELRLRAEGADLAAVLKALFQLHPSLRSYVLDERGVLRHHVAIFIDGQAIPDKRDFGAWFVPAVKDEQRYPVDGRFVVARTRDFGARFDVLDQGLPTSEAFDLVYRHGLAIDPDGLWLAMGSTTGGLWISANHGDHWQALPQRLPPVYAVGFG